MVSSFYSSNQQKLKHYTKDRRVEDHNGDLQQAKVYKKIAEDKGDIEAADTYAKLGLNILNRIGEQIKQHEVNPHMKIEEQKFDVRNYLKQAIQNGTLSQLWNAMKKVPKSKLGKVAQIIQHDVKYDSVLKDAQNELLLKYKNGEIDLKDLAEQLEHNLDGGNKEAAWELVSNAWDNMRGEASSFPPYGELEGLKSSTGKSQEEQFTSLLKTIMEFGENESLTKFKGKLEITDYLSGDMEKELKTALSKNRYLVNHLNSEKAETLTATKLKPYFPQTAK